MAKRKSRKTKKKVIPGIVGRIDVRSYVKITPKKLMEAIKDTGGIKQRIAKNAGCSYNTCIDALKNPHKKWDECRLELALEKQRIGDTAERTMHYLITQRLDFGVAYRSSKFMLSRQFKDRGYADESTLNIKSDSPLVQINNTHIDISMLKLPVNIKVQILNAIEVYNDEQTKLIEGKA